LVSTVYRGWISADVFQFAIGVVPSLWVDCAALVIE